MEKQWYIFNQAFNIWTNNCEVKFKVFFVELKSGGNLFYVFSGEDLGVLGTVFGKMKQEMWDFKVWGEWKRNKNDLKE